MERKKEGLMERICWGFPHSSFLSIEVSTSRGGGWDGYPVPCTCCTCGKCRLGCHLSTLLIAKRHRPLFFCFPTVSLTSLSH